MIVLDIDGTISPTAPKEDGLLDSILPVEEARAFGFNVMIPTYILNLLRNPPMEIALLSTWGAGAKSLAEAFQFEARILDMEDYTLNSGIQGKHDTILHFKDEVRAWADDHISTRMRDELRAEGIFIAIPPRHSCLTRGHIADLSALQA